MSVGAMGDDFSVTFVQCLLFSALIVAVDPVAVMVEPLTILLLAYLSYLSAELFHFSGIIGICCCGLMQAHYAFNNISHKSLTTVTYFSKMLSTASDCMIFMFLGLTLVRPDHDWHTGFTLWTLFLCLVIRFMSVFGLTLIANKLYRLRKIELEEQFIMAYGGLRGAVCFSLVAMLNENDVPRFRAFLTTTLVVIIFTVFIQGGTIKPLVKLLQIKKKKNKVVSMSEEINYHVTDHVLAGIEEIMGTHGDHWLRESVNRLDLQYLKKWLQNNPQRHDEQIMELFQEIALRQHYENVAGTEAAKRWASSIDIAPEFEGDEPPKSPSPEALKDLLHEYMQVTTAILHRTTDLEKSDREKLAQRIRSGSGGSLDFNHELHVPTVPRPSLPFLAVR
ncbi:sodium/hydrogen exchanger 1-like, partial [Lingula anatina]|uniref:Sodium/hydrogen exchanger n=1 Tax=Lingula anatina TaxID=7574 RepID=A0A1S3IGT6_LINAN